MGSSFFKSSAYLAAFNEARKRAGLAPAADWFDFSVPEMFRAETAKEAWDYWRWRTLRAIVQPATDYQVKSARLHCCE